jgi:hypothetical protein
MSTEKPGIMKLIGRYGWMIFVIIVTALVLALPAMAALGRL